MRYSVSLLCGPRPCGMSHRSCPANRSRRVGVQLSCVDPRPRPIRALRNQLGSTASDPRRCVIFADQAVVEQHPQSVLVEVAVSAGDPLGVLDFRLRFSVGPFDTGEWSKYATSSSRQACRVRPRRASSGIGHARSAATRSAARMSGVGGIVEAVERREPLRDGPGGRDLAVGVAPDQPVLQPGPLLRGQVVDAAAQQHPADAIQRVTGAAAVPVWVCCTRRRTSSTAARAPRSMTWRITVHHATPSPATVRDTAAPADPTRSNAHLRARSVRLARGAIAGCCSVQVRRAKRLRAGPGPLDPEDHHGPPANAQVAYSRRRRSFARAAAPRSRQPTRSAVVWTSISSSSPAFALAGASCTLTRRYSSTPRFAEAGGVPAR